MKEREKEREREKREREREREKRKNAIGPSQMYHDVRKYVVALGRKN